jgi:SpoVK/Ycf46/Vps4 family AAA+-type ATPase
MASDLELSDECVRALRATGSSLRDRGEPKGDSRVSGRRTRGAWTGVWLAGGDAGMRTKAAEILASEVRQRLHRVDLRATAGKYIGETEKNLERVLQAAVEAEVVLFLDEADALFGSRTDVKDAHDRYASLEVSHLLQRLERYSGLVILGTNHRQDPAPELLLRLRHRVELAPAPPPE